MIQKNMTIQEILESGMAPEDQAKAIARFYANKSRTKTVEEERRDIRSKCLAGVTKHLTKGQQEALMYEFLSANAGYISNWMRKQHPNLYLASYTSEKSYTSEQE